MDYSLKAPLERTLYTILNMWLAGQRAGGGWEPTTSNKTLSDTRGLGLINAGNAGFKS